MVQNLCTPAWYKICVPVHGTKFPLEYYCLSTGQEIPQILRNLGVQYCFHKRTTVYPFLSQLNLVPFHKPYFLNTLTFNLDGYTVRQ